MPEPLWLLIEALRDVQFQYWITVFLGLVIVYSFAVGKYDSPTYAKTSIGNLAQLSPRSLASDSRYKKGFGIYVVCLFAIYSILCIVGPKIFVALGFPSSEFLQDEKLWPIAVASALTVAGAARDDRFPGNVEGLIRRKAHEAAYIPTAVTALAYQLRSFSLADWLQRSPAKELHKFQSRIGEFPGLSLKDVAKLEEGKVVSWVRANILFLHFQQLDAEKYGRIKAQDETREAEQYLVGLHASARSRLSSVDFSNLSLEDALSKDIDAFFEGASVLLAATVLQAAPDARALSSALSFLDFKDTDAVGRQAWQQYATFEVAVISLTCAALAVFMYLFPSLVLRLGSLVFTDLKNLDLMQDHGYRGRIIETAVSAVVLYVTMFLVMLYVREKRLTGKRWEEKLGTYVEFSLWTSVPAAVISTVILLANAQIEGVWVILIFSLALSVLGSIFFVFHMRGSARCEDSVSARLLHIFGPGAVLHGLLAVLFAGVLVSLTYYWTIENRPGWSMSYVARDFDTAAEKLREQEEGKRGMFSGRHEPELITAMKERVNSLSREVPKLQSGDANGARQLMAKVVEVCRLLDNPLPPDAKLFMEHSEKACMANQGSGAGTAADANVFQLVRNLEALWGSLSDLGDPLAIEHSRQDNWLQVTITCLFALFAALSFSCAARFGRVEQLGNQIDRFDESALDKLFTRAKTSFAQRGEDADLKRWLVTPNPTIGLLTPLEAVRYQPYRAPLFDSLPIKTERKRSVEAVAPASGTDRQVSGPTVVSLRG
jgi:hypothetical protein